MARADSTIRVSIIGDVKNLTRAMGRADNATASLLRGTLAVGAGFIGVQKGFDFLQDATQEADRLGDAMGRLSTQLSSGTAEMLKRTADNFTRIGASSQDILEAEAIFADWATTAGIADSSIAGLAESVAATATALTLTDDQGRDTNAMLDLMNKAAGGSAKAAKELGVTITEGLSPMDQMRSILSQLAPKLVEATTGTQDLESKQRELQARTEELSAKLGEQLAPALASVLTIITDGLDDIDGAIWGFQQLGNVIDSFARGAVGHLQGVADVLGHINSLLRSTSSGVGAFDQRDVSERRTVQSVNNFDSRNGATRTTYNRIGGP